MNHEYTIEIIYHITCSRCKSWWSHAHTPIMNNNNDEFMPTNNPFQDIKTNTITEVIEDKSLIPIKEEPIKEIKEKVSEEINTESETEKKESTIKDSLPRVLRPTKVDFEKKKIDDVLAKISENKKELLYKLNKAKKKYFKYNKNFLVPDGKNFGYKKIIKIVKNNFF